MRVAHSGNFEEAAAALLPCDWIYVRVGGELEKAGSPNPLYQRWIDTYASEEVWEIVRRMIEIVDTVAEEVAESRKAAMQRHFTVTSRYEWMFWDMAWRKEAWPL